MQHAVADLLGAALVPVLGADVAAGAAGDVHLGLVGVAALRASNTRHSSAGCHSIL